MYCNKCGKKVDDHILFCPDCGNKVSQDIDNKVMPAEAPRKEKKKKSPFGVIFGFLVLFLVIGAGIFLCSRLCNTEDSYEGEGFESAEDAALAYVEALREGDVEKMLSTFAIETYVKNFDVEAYIENLGFIQPKTTHKITAKTEYAEELNTYIRIGELAENIENQYLYMMLPEECSDLLEGMTIAVKDYPGGASQMEEDLSNPDYVDRLRVIEDIEVADTFSREEIFSIAEMADRVLEKEEKIYGTDEITAVCVEFKIDGETYLFYVDVFRYGDVWYNGTFCGTGGLALEGMRNNVGGTMRK